MLADFPGATLLTVVLSCCPPLLRWWWGRALARRSDDPVLPERLFTLNTRLKVMFALSAALLMVTRPPYAGWGIAVLIVGNTAAAYPLRKAVYGETWTLAGFLSFFSRLYVAVFGFWVVIATAPWLAQLSGRFDVITGAALALMLTLWNVYYCEALRAIVRARPVADAALLARFQGLAAKAGIPAPRFDYVDLRGGFLCNALALPSLRQSGVLFTDSLLARFSGDQIVAICAHELAHLEYYNRRRMVRLAIWNYALIAGAVASAPLCRWFLDSSTARIVSMIWPGVVFISLGVRGRHRQRNETESDVRAVELAGDAEALASALTDLHLLARIPRRWDRRQEQHATHPSLARRLRDIRSAAGVAAPTVTAPASFNAEDGAAIVTFEPSHLSWREQSGVTHLLEYGSLSELRLHASSAGAISLIAVERQGRRWQMTPPAGDQPSLQQLLDSVDGRLAHDVHDAKSHVFSAVVTRLAALLAMLLAALAVQFAVVFAALIACVTATRSMLNAAAAAALVGAATIIRDGPSPMHDETFAVVILVGIAAGLLALGYVRRNENGQPTRATTAATLSLAAGAILSSVMICSGGINPVRLYQGAQQWPGATVLFAALAVACWRCPGRSALRYVPPAALACAATAAILASGFFLDLAGRDPFLFHAPHAHIVQQAGPEIGRFDVPFDVGTVRLSPHGTLVALTRDEDEDAAEPAAPLFHVSRATGALSHIEASDLVFVDDRRALALAGVDGGMEVREISFDNGPVVRWRQRVPGLRSGDLAYRGDAHQWVVLGRDANNYVVRAAGTLGTAGYRMDTWPGLTSRGGWTQAIAASGEFALVVDQHYEFGSFARVLPWLAPLTHTYPEIRLAQARRGGRREIGRSLFEAGCDALDDGRVLCAAFDGRRTHIATIEADTAAIGPVATMAGRFWATDVSSPGWIAGWNDSTPVALRLSTREIVRAPYTRGEFTSAIAATDAVIATVAARPDSSRVRLYPRSLAPRPQ